MHILIGMFLKIGFDYLAQLVLNLPSPCFNFIGAVITVCITIPSFQMLSKEFSV